MTSCDDDDSGSARIQKLEFPKTLLSGDKFTLTRDQTPSEIANEEDPEVDVLEFDSELTFKWGSENFTIGSYRASTSNEEVLIRNAAIDNETRAAQFRSVYGELLQQFNNPIRTILRENHIADEEITLEQLHEIAAILNANFPDTENGEPLVAVDEVENRLLLLVEYDFKFLLNPHQENAYQLGFYHGRFEETRYGLVLKFDRPTGAEKNSFRLDSNDRIIRVSGSNRRIHEIREGNFTWELTSESGFREDEVEDEVEGEQTQN